MKDSVPYVMERGRISHGNLLSRVSDGFNGAFRFQWRTGTFLQLICSDGRDWQDSGLPGEPWEHVSVVMFVNGKPCVPSWEAMCFVKDLCWPPDDCVVQYHPPKSKYVNDHEHVLHLWRPVNGSIPTPPQDCV